MAAKIPTSASRTGNLVVTTTLIKKDLSSQSTIVGYLYHIYKLSEGSSFGGHGEAKSLPFTYNGGISPTTGAQRHFLVHL